MKISLQPMINSSNFTNVQSKNKTNNTTFKGKISPSEAQDIVERFGRTTGNILVDNMKQTGNDKVLWQWQFKEGRLFRKARGVLSQTLSISNYQSQASDIFEKGKTEKLQCPHQEFEHYNVFVPDSITRKNIYGIAKMAAADGNLDGAITELKDIFVDDLNSMGRVEKAANRYAKLNKNAGKK